MANSQAKLIRGGIHSKSSHTRIVAILSDKREPFTSSLEIRCVKIFERHTLLHIVGRKAINTNINIIVASSGKNYLVDDEVDLQLKSFLGGLGRGVVSEIRGCLIVEFSAKLIYLNIVRASSNFPGSMTENDDSAVLSGEKLIAVDSGGDCYCWLHESAASARDHGWRYITNFRISSAIASSQRITKFNYDPANGEVVFVCRREGPNLGGYCEAPIYIDEVNVCSLQISALQIQLSTCVMLCSLPQIHNVHYTANGIWIARTDGVVQYFNYLTCTMHAFHDIKTSIAECSTMVPELICASCICDAPANRASTTVTQLYVIIQDALYIIHFVDGLICVRSVHSLIKMLHHDRAPQNMLCIEDMVVPVEESDRGCDSAVICLATSSRCYIFQVSHTQRHSYETSSVTEPIPVTRYISIDIPKPRGRSVSVAPVYFVPVACDGNAESSGDEEEPAVYICRGTTLFALRIEAVGKESASPARRSFTNPFEEQLRNSPQQAWFSLFIDHSPRSQMHAEDSHSSVFSLSRPTAEPAFQPSVSMIFADSTLKQLLAHANSKAAHTKAAVLSLDEALSQLHAAFPSASQLDAALLAHCNITANSGTQPSEDSTPSPQLTIDLVRSTLSAVISAEAVRASTISRAAPGIKREVSMPNIRRENVDMNTRHWLDEIDIITLHPPHTAVENAAEYLQGAMEPLLLMQLSQCLHRTSNDDAHLSDASKTQATLLDVFLKMVALTRPDEVLSLVHALLEIERRNTVHDHSHGSKLSVTAEQVPNIHRATTSAPGQIAVRTTIGIPPHSDHQVLYGVREQEPQYASPQHTEVEDDDDIFGISTVVHQRHRGQDSQNQAQRAALNLQVRHRLQNISRTVYLTTDGISAQDGQQVVPASPAEEYTSDSDGSDEGSQDDGDAFGVFRDVGEDGDEDTNDDSHAPSTGAPVAGTLSQVSGARQVERILAPLLIPTSDTPTEAAIASTSASIPSFAASLQDRCTNMASAQLALHLRNSTQIESPKLNLVQEDCLLKILLTCGGAVQVVEYLIQARRFKALTILALRVAASADALLAAQAGNISRTAPCTSAYYSEGRGKHQREADLAAVAALFSASANELQGNGEQLWDTLIIALLLPEDDYLLQTNRAPRTPPSAAQLRLLEAIVIYKLALRCFLSKQVLTEIYYSNVLDLVRYRPSVLTADVMRSWVNAFTASTEHRDKILRQCK